VKINYTKKALGPFFPVIVGSYINNKANYLAVGAWGAVDMIPTLFVAIKKTHYSTRGIEDSGYYSINIPTKKLACELDFCGIFSGENVDKTKLFDYKNEYSEKAPVINDCPLTYLCKVIRKEESNDFDLFFGQIENILVDDELISNGNVLVDKLNPITMITTKYLDGKEIIGNAFSLGNKMK
jgi:flavin reductase (DIM6/NTAB) family NADH-FMN oxidoreductase RutF